jgi:hypothetical protein
MAETTPFMSPVRFQSTWLPSKLQHILQDEDHREPRNNDPIARDLWSMLHDYGIETGPCFPACEARVIDFDCNWAWELDLCKVASMVA